MAVVVIRTMASRVLMILGSGTRSTATSFLPRQHRARMGVLRFGCVRLAASRRRARTCRARLRLAANRSELPPPVGLSLGGGDFTRFEHLLEPPHVGAGLGLGGFAEHPGDLRP